MPKIDLPRTVHVGGKVFFKGEAFVSDQDKILIDAELKRLEELEAGQEADTPKKTTKKADK